MPNHRDPSGDCSLSASGKLAATQIRLQEQAAAWEAHLQDVARKRKEAQNRAQRAREQMKERSIVILQEEQNRYHQQMNNNTLIREQQLEELRVKEAKRKRCAEEAERRRKRREEMKKTIFDHEAALAAQRHALTLEERATHVAETNEERRLAMQRNLEALHRRQELNYHQKMDHEDFRDHIVQQQMEERAQRNKEQRLSEFSRVQQALSRNEEIVKRKREHEMEMNRQKDHRRIEALTAHQKIIAERRARKEQHFDNVRRAVEAAERARAAQAQRYEQKYRETISIGNEARAFNLRHCSSALAALNSSNNSRSISTL